MVAGELDRHLKVAKEWFPHEYVPWSEGRDFDGSMGGEAWRRATPSVPEAARVSLIVNLLTEDNLPSYHHEIATTFGRDGAWGTWVHRWTAEEGRHGIAHARLPDGHPRGRPGRAGAGPHGAHAERLHVTDDEHVLQQLAYVSFQELATRDLAPQHRQGLRRPEGCERLLARIAADENLHMLFYRNLLKAAFELAPEPDHARRDRRRHHLPDARLRASRASHRKAMIIANEGIYDLRLHLDDVLMPVLRQWAVFDQDRSQRRGRAGARGAVGVPGEGRTTAARFVARREERKARAMK